RRSRGGVPQSRRLAANRQHVPRRGVGAKAEMMVAEGELLGEPTVKGDDGVVVDLVGGGGIVAHLVVHPRVPVVRLVEVGRVGQEVSVVHDFGAPLHEAGEVEVSRLVLLDEDHDPLRQAPRGWCRGYLPFFSPSLVRLSLGQTYTIQPNTMQRM